jgi:hypothetical protein
LHRPSLLKPDLFAADGDLSNSAAEGSFRGLEGSEGSFRLAAAVSVSNELKQPIMEWMDLYQTERRY